jgi:uroporphyrinogen-III synthase
VGPLEGLGVLVTRPEPQGAPLASLLENAGARVRRLPAIEIVPAADRDALRATVGPIDAYRWLIFVSTNAVRYGAFLLEDARIAPKLAAVGPATAAALDRAGLRVGVVPAGGFDSEALLATPELSDVAGARVLIVRGDGGRELLSEELRRRGADVRYAEVYARRRAQHAPEVIADVERAWARGEIDVVTATSAELHRALLEILGPAGRERLNATTLLAGGTRIAEAARRAGHAGDVVVARAADDASLLDALIESRRHTSRS